MRQRKPRGLADILRADLIAVMPGGQRDRRPSHDQVRAQPVYLERAADSADLLQDGIGQPHHRQPLTRRDYSPSDPFGIKVPAGGEGDRVRFVSQPAPDHLGALRRIPGRGHLDGQPEPVEQLGPELAFLRVHGAHQQEPGRVPHGQPFPLDVVHAEGGGVQQQVDKMIMKEVHLVHVEQTAVRRGEQARLERCDPVGQRPLDVQRAGQPVLGGADGQLGQPGRPGQRRGLARMRAVRAAGVRRGRVAGEPAVRDDVHGRQQRGDPAHHRRLRGAFLAPHEHAADRR